MPPARLPRRSAFFLFASSFFLSSSASAADWTHWRGPEQNGVSKVTGLPDHFGVAEAGKDGLLWKAAVGGRSAPIFLNGKLYLITGYDPGQLTEGERVVCFDAETGAKVWEQRFGVFHTDIVSSRLGWTSPTADPETGNVFCHGTQGHVFCFDGTDGKILWRRNLTEEFGRVTGYGGRIVNPIFDSGLVIVGMANASWGNHAIGRSRFVAFDAKTGQVAWWADPSEEAKTTLRGTYYSNPVIAVVNGQRLLISGGADGAVHAIKVRTGERVWSQLIAANVVNPSPVVDGSRVYISHGEENPGGGPLGKVICLEAAQVDPKTKRPKVVWETTRIRFKNGTSRSNIRFGLASAALADGILYLPSDDGELYAFDAKTGNVLWTHKYGTVSRGAPLVADGKLYVFDVNARLACLKLNGEQEPQELQTVAFRGGAGGGFTETNGTPIAVNGKLYFCTREATYCVGKPGAGSSAGAYKPLPPETPFNPNAEPAGLRVFPAEVALTAGGTQRFEAKFVDGNGREVNAPAGAAVAWSLPQPPLPPTAPKGAAQPPALQAKADGQGTVATLTVNPAPPTQHGLLAAKAGKLTASARVRVAATLPYRNDFDKAPAGSVPGGWVNTQGKFVIKKLPDGGQALAKVNTDPRPPLARANGYITPPTAGDYTIECDIQGTEVRGKMPDAGVVNSRYTLLLDGKTDPELKKRVIRMNSWDARERVNVVVPFDWKPNTWYRVKLTVTPDGKQGAVRGKVWERGQPEPAAWQIDFKDPNPNTEGAAALFGYVSNITDEPGADIYYDNLSITPNAKK